jgi:hypothetical protein
MSNESSVNSVEMVDRARSWDHPNGLGWQLWRRAQSTGLLIQPIQRDLALFRASIRDPAPLASDIRRRWGVGANTSVDRFGLDLPFFFGTFSFFPREHSAVSFRVGPWDGAPLRRYFPKLFGV